MNAKVIGDHFGLDGKTALITGASGGIGRELAVGLAAAGARIGITGRSSEQLHQTRLAIESVGGRADILMADLDALQSCSRLIDDAKKAMGRIDILVNCAGMNRRKPIEQVTGDDFETIVNVNLRPVFFLSQAVHPIMREQGGGKIIHVASLTSSMALDGTAVYGLTKGASWQLARTQAVEWTR